MSIEKSDTLKFLTKKTIKMLRLELPQFHFEKIEKKTKKIKLES